MKSKTYDQTKTVQIGGSNSSDPRKSDMNEVDVHTNGIYSNKYIRII